MTENTTTQTKQDQLRAQAQELRTQASNLQAEAAAARRELTALEAVADQGGRPDPREYQQARDLMNLRSRGVAGLNGQAAALDAQAAELDRAEHVQEIGVQAAALVTERAMRKDALRRAQEAWEKFDAKFPEQWSSLRGDVQALGLPLVTPNSDEDGELGREVIDPQAGLQVLPNTLFKLYRLGGHVLNFADPDDDLEHLERLERLERLQRDSARGDCPRKGH